MTDRSEIMSTRGALNLVIMRGTYDELTAVAVWRQRNVGDRLSAEIDAKKARSVKDKITIAKLPFAREIEAFTFDGTPINDTLVRDPPVARPSTSSATSC